MSSGPQKSCKECGRRLADGWNISYRGLCDEHGESRQIENLRQLRAHHGPFAKHHRLRILAAWGGVPTEIFARER